MEVKRPFDRNQEPPGYGYWFLPKESDETVSRVEPTDDCPGGGYGPGGRWAAAQARAARSLAALNLSDDQREKMVAIQEEQPRRTGP